MENKYQEKTQEILEGNKLIAEFMGAEHPNPNVNYWSFHTYPGKETKFSHTKLKYHSSWDWLMPVVDKIVTELPEYDCETKLINVLKALTLVDIEELWKAVVEFIKWYNNGKQV